MKKYLILSSKEINVFPILADIKGKAIVVESELNSVVEVRDKIEETIEFSQDDILFVLPYLNIEWAAYGLGEELDKKLKTLFTPDQKV